MELYVVSGKLLHFLVSLSLLQVNVHLPLLDYHRVYLIKVFESQYTVLFCVQDIGNVVQGFKRKIIGGVFIIFSQEI